MNNRTALSLAKTFGLMISASIVFSACGSANLPSASGLTTSSVQISESSDIFGIQAAPGGQTAQAGQGGAQAGKGGQRPPQGGPGAQAGGQQGGQMQPPPPPRGQAGQTGVATQTQQAPAGGAMQSPPPKPEGAENCDKPQGPPPRAGEAGAAGPEGAGAPPAGQQPPHRLPKAFMDALAEHEDLHKSFEALKDLSPQEHYAQLKVLLADYPDLLALVQAPPADGAAAGPRPPKPPKQPNGAPPSGAPAAPPADHEAGEGY